MTQAGAASPRSNRFAGLELLRLVAAVCVLMLHTRAVYGGKFVFGRGYLAVDFFLMLSGYLMARGQEARLAGGLNPWRFIAARYRRLWPMMALGGLIGLPMVFLRAHSLAEFAGVSIVNLALLPALLSYFAFPLNIPAWTIFAELMVNSMHVLGLWRLRGWWLAALFAALLAGMAWAAMAWGSFDLGAKPATLLPGIMRCLLAYVIGMAAARIWGDTPPRLLLGWPVPPLLALVVMPAAIVAAWALGLHGGLFDMGFVLLVCPLMLAGGLRLRRFGIAAGWLGQLAFPLFAVQMPVLQGMQRLGFHYWSGLAAAVAVGIVATAASAWLRQRGRNVATL